MALVVCPVWLAVLLPSCLIMETVVLGLLLLLPLRLLLLLLLPTGLAVCVLPWRVWFLFTMRAMKESIPMRSSVLRLPMIHFVAPST